MKIFYHVWSLTNKALFLLPSNDTFLMFGFKFILLVVFDFKKKKRLFSVKKKKIFVIALI